MIKAWMCADCCTSNLSQIIECVNCGGINRRLLYPVRVPNQAQNTRSYSDLEAQLALDEDCRVYTPCTPIADGADGPPVSSQQGL